MFIIYVLCYLLASRIVSTSKDPYHLSQRIRKKPDSDTSKINSKTIEGYAWPLKNTIRNTRGRDCVLLIYELQVEQRIGRVMRWWNTIRTYRYQVPFLVIKNDDVYLVAPPDSKDYKFDIESETEKFRITYIPQSYEDILNAVHQQKKPLLHEDYRLVEKKILVGSTVLVDGILSKPNSPSVQINGDIYKYIEFTKKIDTDINYRNKVLDLNQDGTIFNSEEKQALNNFAKDSQDTFKQFVDITAEIKHSDQNMVAIADTYKKSLLKKYESAAAFYFFGVVLRIISLAFMANSIIGTNFNYLKNEPLFL